MSGKASVIDQPATLVDRRRRVGIIALACGLLSAFGLWGGYQDSAWPAACLRIGIVLGALWLCLPVSRRPTVWNGLGRGRLAVLVLMAVFVNRIKVLFPILLVIGIVIWIVRPKKRR
ncbi:MAG: hypothetical protein U0936_01090 [Planctomycetaceae bacterium]